MFSSYLQLTFSDYAISHLIKFTERNSISVLELRHLTISIANIFFPFCLLQNNQPLENIAMGNQSIPFDLVSGFIY